MRWKSLPVVEQELREDAQGDYHNDMREGKGTQVGADGSQYVRQFRVTTSECTDRETGLRTSSLTERKGTEFTKQLTEQDMKEGW